jgi:hypothetical protein
MTSPGGNLTDLGKQTEENGSCGTKKNGSMNSWYEI